MTLWRKIRKKLAGMSTRQLVMIPILVSLLPLLVLVLISQGGVVGTGLQKLLIYVMVFLWGTTGIPLIVRREDPGIVVIYGWPAVAMGVVMLIGSWVFIIYSIITEGTR